jgi:predicted RNase H-like HicB family nuclease
MSKPNYRVVLTFDAERKVFLARAPELEHCTAEGLSRAEAISKVEEEIDAQLANMLSHGSTPPRSVDEEDFSGEVTAKISKLLHRDLAYLARTEGIDLDHLLGEMLAAGLELRRQHRGVARPQQRPTGSSHEHDNIGNRSEGGPRRQGFGGRNNNFQLLDDRANFIEYVRTLEQSNGQPPGRGGGHNNHHQHHNNGNGGGRRRRGRGGPRHENFRPHGQGAAPSANFGAPRPSGEGAVPKSDGDGEI